MSHHSDLDMLKTGLGNKRATIPRALVKKLGHEGGVLSQFILYKKGRLWLPHVVSELGEHHVATDDGFSICFFDDGDLTPDVIEEKCGWNRAIDTREPPVANFLAHRLAAENCK